MPDEIPPLFPEEINRILAPAARGAAAPVCPLCGAPSEHETRTPLYVMTQMRPIAVLVVYSCRNGHDWGPVHEQPGDPDA
jgi:hypothetical protein